MRLIPHGPHHATPYITYIDEMPWRRGMLATIDFNINFFLGGYVMVILSVRLKSEKHGTLHNMNIWSSL